MGDAWEFFPHDHARSPAYRWGEDGIAGISDRYQYICFSLSLWIHNDPILKERLFALPIPDVDYGCAIAALTEYDGAQRTYEYPRRSVEEASEFRERLVAETRERGFIHARPWLWSA